MSETVLPVPVMAQQLRLWCWAAITSGVSQFSGSPAVLSQCEVATRVIGASCCASPAVCNLTMDLDAAIRSIPLLCSVDPPVLFATLAGRIVNAGRPVGLRMLNRFDFSAHFILVTGCDPAVQTVICTDPWGTVGAAAPRYRMEFKALANYGGWGQWTHSFLIG
jgi:hypothetical protein